VTKDYWAVGFADPPCSYLFIGWDQTVKEADLPAALGFRMILFKTRKDARAWTTARNASMLYWTNDSHYLRVKRVRVTVAPPPRIKGKLI
jgi:hypothetical protein